MVAISTYKTFWEYIRTVVPGINQVYVVHEEFDIAAIIKDIADADVILLAVVPSSDTEASSSDDIKEFDSCFMFVVKKIDRSNLTHDEFLQQWEMTQAIMGDVKDKMIELAGDYEHCQNPGTYGHLMHRLVIGGMHTDPEYNLHGCLG